MSSKLVLYRAKDATEGSAESVSRVLLCPWDVKYKYNEVHDCADLRHIITQC